MSLSHTLSLHHSCILTHAYILIHAPTLTHKWFEKQQHNILWWNYKSMQRYIHRYFVLFPNIECKGRVNMLSTYRNLCHILYTKRRNGYIILFTYYIYFNMFVGVFFISITHWPTHCCMLYMHIYCCQLLSLSMHLATCSQHALFFNIM